MDEMKDETAGPAAIGYFDADEMDEE